MKIDPDNLPPPKEPYRGILPFRLLDWRIFVERDIETERLGNVVSMYSGVLLYGQSGAGKSSLLNAGLLPQVLRNGGAPERIRVFPESGGELLVERIRLREENDIFPKGTALPSYLPSRFTCEDTDDRIELSCQEFSKHLHAPSELGPPLLIFDQFEEFVTLFEENPKDEQRFKSAQAARTAIEKLLFEMLLNDQQPVTIIFAFRDDYLARLTPFFARIPNLMDQRVMLMPPRVEQTRKIVRGPFVRAHFEDELNEDIAAKIADGMRRRAPSGILNLSELQTLCEALWRQPKLRGELLRAIDPAAVLQKILESQALVALRRFFRWDQLRALVLLSNLVTKDGTRNVVSEQNLISESRRNPMMWVFRGDLKKLLSRLHAETGLLRRSLCAGNTYYELASEFLIPWLQRHQRKFRKLALVVWGYFSVAIAALLVFVAVQRHRADVSGRMAEETKDKAVAAKEAADGLINFLQYDIYGTVTKIGHLDVVSNINWRVRNHFEEHPPEPGDLGAIRGKAVSLLQFGDVLFASGSLIEASEQHHAALKMFQELFNQNPEKTDYQRDLFITYQRIGNAQRDQGDGAAALKSYRNSLTITEKLVEQNPRNADWQRDLSAAHEKVGAVLRDQGDRVGALKSYSDSLGIAERLVKQDPSNPDWQHALFWVYISVGDVQRDQGDRAGALKSYSDSLGIVERLVKRGSHNADWKLSLAAGYERLGDVQRDQGDLPGALKSYRGFQATMEELVMQDPSNLGWQRDLTAAYERVGDVLRDQGDRAGALKSFRDGLTIGEKLTKRDSNNVSWQWDLSGLYADVGKVLRDQDDLVGALKSYRDSTAIRERLSKQDPNNAGWQGDLAWIYWQTGAVRAKVEPESKNDARAMVEKGRDILLQLKKRTGLTAEQQKWLDAIDAELRAM